MEKRLLKITAMVVLMTVIMCQAVWADDSASTCRTDAAGNAFIAGNEVTAGDDVDNELFAAGQTVTAGKVNVGNNLFAAGGDVTVDGTLVKGTVFAAGYNVSINAKASGNIWTAGNYVELSENCAAKAVGAAANEVVIRGEYKSAHIIAGNVTIDGTVTEELNITADQVEFGPNAVVKGTIKVVAEAEPVVDRSAEISEIDYTPSETEDSGYPYNRENGVNSVLSIVLSALGVVIVAFLLSVFAGSGVESAKRMIESKPVAVLVSGLLANIAAVVITVPVMLTGFGLRAGLLIVALYSAILIVGTAFASASLGRVVFERLRPGFNPLLSSVICAAVIGLLKEVPYIGFLISFACEIYTLGYFVQLAYEEAKKISSSKTIEKELNILE